MIQLLSEEVINKIAAGEVIERPASIIKELIENSIDANATRIEIEAEEYGKKLISVKDNGAGMSREDAELAVRRHATSKITAEEDLSSVRTLGFRGEALASIAAVSRLSMTTRQKGAIEGFKIEIEGGKILSKKSVGCAEGTWIEARDIFFNTPVRKKFLKSDTSELNAIVEIVTRYALFYNDIAFLLRHNGHIIINTAKSADILNNISSIYGSEAARQLMKVDYKNNFARIYGYISKPSLLKADKSWQNLYVNRRFVKNDALANAVYDAYHTLLFVNKHPVAVLNVEISPESVDVNVHPTKDIVKFSNQEMVYDALFDALRKVLHENELLADYTAAGHADERQVEFRQIRNRQLQNQFSKIESGKTMPLLKPEMQAIISAKKDAYFEKLPKMKILGQIAKTYFLAESDNGFLLIDQHVVQERILYEKFMDELMGGKVAVQQLVNPAVLELSPKEVIVVRENISQLESMGFEVEEFGGKSIALRTVPTLFSRIQPKELLSEVIESLSEEKGSPVERIKESIITRMACRASIKAGDECSVPQMEALLLELDKTKLPWTCPHGRPIIIRFTMNEIEKMFKRKA